MHDRTVVPALLPVGSPAWLRTAWIVAVLLAMSSAAQAQIPTELNYQGKLSQNSQLADGTYQFTFRIYDGPGGGANLLWTEVHPSVLVDQGAFEVNLGSITTFDSQNLMFDIPYFLGVQVNTNSEMSPRKALTSVGYALNAVNAQNADNAQNAQNAQNASNAQNAQKANRSNRSNFSEGVKEDKVAMVMTALRGGGVPDPNSAVYLDPVAAMADVAEWCGVPSTTNTCLVKIWPGLYNLGASNLTMQSYIDIEGSGPNTTVLATDGQVFVTGGAEIRELSIEKQTGTGDAVQVDGVSSIRHAEIRVASSLSERALLVFAGAPIISDVRIIGPGPAAIEINPGTDPMFRRVDVIASSTTEDATGIQVPGTTSIMMEDVHIEVTAGGGFNATGVVNGGDSTTVMRDVDIKVDATGGGVAKGIYNGVTSSPELDGVRIRVQSGSGGAAVGIHNDTSTARISNSTVGAELTGAGLATGVLNEGGAPDLSNVHIESLGSGSGSFGVDSVSSATVRIENSTVFSDDVAIRSGGGSSSMLASTRLNGSVVGGGANFICIGVYDGGFSALSSTCQ